MTLVERMLRWTAPWTTIDLRSLAAFRITLGIAILVDVLDRARALDLYTEAGPVQLDVMGDVVPTFHRGPPAFVAALFVVHALLAVAFCLGWRTRVVGVLLFAFVVSLQARCPLAFYLGDDLTRVLLFWSCLLPVGARLSVDSKRSRAPGVVRSFAAGGLLLVPVTLFFFTAVEKVVWPAWRDGRALGLFVDTWIYPTTLGAAVFETAPSVFPALTIAALVAEGVLPLLLLTTWWRVRLLGAVGLFALMFGIALMLDVGLFPLVTATALLPVVPSELWSQQPQATDRPALAARARALELLALTCALAMLVTSTANFLVHAPPHPARSVLKLVGLDQRWSMFIQPESAPRGWFLVAGRTAEGEIDRLRAAPLDATHVPEPMSTLLTFRERCVLQRAFVGPKRRYEETAAWLCRSSATPLQSISVGYAEVRGEPASVLVIELMKERPCP